MQVERAAVPLDDRRSSGHVLPETLRTLSDCICLAGTSRHRQVQLEAEGNSLLAVAQVLGVVDIDRVS
jgi:hypothetical protein